jgi:hypothetical protein
MRGRRRQGSLDRAYLELGTLAELAAELSAEEEMTLSRELRVLQRNTAKFIQIQRSSAISVLPCIDKEGDDSLFAKNFGGF